MNQQHILNSVRLPARMDAQQTALVLGFHDHDIPLLVRAKLLKSLGNPTHNATKYFAACEIEQLAADPVWLNKATRALSSYWRCKNGRRHSRVTVDR